MRGDADASLSREESASLKAEGTYSNQNQNVDVDVVGVVVVVVVVVVVANPCLCLFSVCVVIIVRKVDFLLFVYAQLSNKSHVAVVMRMITASMIHTPFWLLDILNGSNFLIGTNLPNVKWIEMELVNSLDKF